jgi:type II secretory pathway pseudopilin PulG
MVIMAVIAIILAILVPVWQMALKKAHDRHHTARPESGIVLSLKERKALINEFSRS